MFYAYSQVSRGFAKYPPSMADLDTGAVVTVEPYGGKQASTSKVLGFKKVKGENECFESTERVGGKSKLSIRKAKESVQVCIVCGAQDAAVVRSLYLLYFFVDILFSSD
jgi:hypothetical protein